MTTREHNNMKSLEMTSKKNFASYKVAIIGHVKKLSTEQAMPTPINSID